MFTQWLDEWQKMTGTRVEKVAAAAAEVKATAKATARATAKAQTKLKA
jgi:signal transduction histidine kinase